MELTQSSAEGWHSGYMHTYQKAKVHFYWLGMKFEIKTFVASCDVYQRNKGKNALPTGHLQPLPIPEMA